MNPWVASYRLQLSRHFSFNDVCKHLKYFQRLGVSHLYLSPVFESLPGSLHGYDVVDPNQISSERGGEEAFYHLCQEMEKYGLGLILDIVPNHLSTHNINPYWRDVLLQGEQSQYAQFFDIDWDADKNKKLVLPVLADPLSEILEKNELTIEQIQGQPTFIYHHHRFPIHDGSKIGIENSPEQIKNILEQQNYRLMFWREGLQKVNYRRFFDINDLAAVKASDPPVFLHLHRKLQEILTNLPTVQGLRVDHVDGIADPKIYLQQLKALCDQTGRSIKIWVEKILSEKEILPRDWPCEGTTGYEFSQALDTISVDPVGFKVLKQQFQDSESEICKEKFTRQCTSAKEQVLRELFPSEVQRLSQRLHEFTDWSVQDSEDIFIALTSTMPVYRTYYTSHEGWSQQDLKILQATFQATAKARPDLETRLEILRSHLLAADPPWDSWIVSWQQLSGPAMAKGYEDTLLYRYYPLTSLCEVGSHKINDPADSTETMLHLFEVRSPWAMNSTSTHDSKRSEDLRWRLHALSEIPHLYMKAYTVWRDLEKSSELDEDILWFIWQSWLGLTGDSLSSPEERSERLQNYIVKALRESKSFSHWLSPNEDCESMARNVCIRLCLGNFHNDFKGLLEELDVRGSKISLKCTTLKFLLPGFPDIYQGCEDWNFRLVDPDNRSPINFEELEEKLKKYQNLPIEQVPMADRKLILTQRLIQTRRYQSKLQRNAF